MTQFLIRKCKTHPIRSKKSHCVKFAPCYLLVFAMFLILTDLTRHLINDDWSQKCEDRADGTYSNVPSKFTKFCYAVPALDMYDKHGHLTTVAFITSIICTWTGFVLMFVAIFWGIDFPRKIKAQWRNVRGARARRSNRQAPLLNAA